LPITTKCPSCGQHYLLADDQAGKSLMCWKCGHTMTVEGQPVEEHGEDPVEEPPKPLPVVIVANTATRVCCSQAIASFVLGLLAIITGPLTGIPASIFGIIAIRRIDQSDGRLTGLGFAIAGICTSAVGTLFITTYGSMILMFVMQMSRF
jgi:hypothetical protein